MNKLVNAATRVCILLSLLLFMLMGLRLAFFPYGVDYGEAPLMDQARHLLAGESIYKSDLDQPPYTIANYPPIYPLLVAGLRQMTGLGWFQAGRAISLTAALISAAFIGLLATRAGSSRTAGWLAAALFLGHPYVAIWSGLARVDLLALAFSLAGLWIVICRPHSHRWLAAAVLLFTLSVFTRQTFLLAAPVTALVWLWNYNRKRALFFVIGLGLLCGSCFVVINTATQGGFYLNTVVANVNRYDWDRTLAMSQQLAVIWLPALALAALTAARSFLQWLRGVDGQPQPASRRFSLAAGLAVYAVLALASALTVGKVGSDINYFLELIAACAILAAAMAVNTAQQPARWGKLIPAILAAQMIWAVISGLFLYQVTAARHWAQIETTRSLYAEVVAASQKGQVLSDDYLDLVFLAGQPITYQPFEYGQLYHAGIWNPNAFAGEISSGKISLILISGETLNKECCWPPELVRAIESHYQVIQYPGYLLCKPAP